MTAQWPYCILSVDIQARLIRLPYHFLFTLKWNYEAFSPNCELDRLKLWFSFCRVLFVAVHCPFRKQNKGKVVCGQSSLSTNQKVSGLELDSPGQHAKSVLVSKLLPVNVNEFHIQYASVWKGVGRRQGKTDKITKVWLH